MNAKLARLQAKVRNYNRLALTANSRLVKVKFLLLALRSERQIELLHLQPPTPSSKWEFTIDTIIGKGKPGWVAKVEFEQKSQRRFGAEYHFVSPESRSGYSFGQERLFFSIPQREGIYVVHDGNFGHRCSDEQVFLIKDGKRRTTASLADAICLYLDNKSLPELEGSAKQVEWAEQIRLNFMAECLGRNIKVPVFVYENTDSKFWIEKREKLSSKAVLDLVLAKLKT